MSVIFMISDGRNYIKRDANGSYVPTTKKNFGDTFDQRYKAKNILENCLNKNLRKGYRVVEFEVKESAKPKSNNNQPNKQKNAIKVEKEEEKYPTVKEINQNIEKYEGQLEKWCSGINSLSEFVKSIEHRRDELSDLLSDVDQEITDIEHYIEFKKLNAFDAWNVYCMMKLRLEKRRKIKNELAILQNLLQCNINSSMIDNIQTKVENLDSKNYTPRKLNALFR